MRFGEPGEEISRRDSVCSHGSRFVPIAGQWQPRAAFIVT